jgi:hypothetical protein
MKKENIFKRIWLCFKSLCSSIDLRAIDAGMIKLEPSCDYTRYELHIHDFDLDSQFLLRTFNTKKEAIDYANSMNWYYPFTDKSRTTLTVDKE